MRHGTKPAITVYHFQFQQHKYKSPALRCVQNLLRIVRSAGPKQLNERANELVIMLTRCLRTSTMSTWVYLNEL